MTEDEMVGWHRRLNGHEFAQAVGVGDGRESLACCSPWGCKELDTTEWLNWTEPIIREFWAMRISNNNYEQTYWMLGSMQVGASLMALPTMQETQETWIWSLGQEYPLEKEIATYSSILAW